MSSASQRIDTYRDELDIRSKSVLSTVFGDIVRPYGTSIWLENLIEIVKPLGINDRLVRTALYRLTDEGWTTGVRAGRKSYYNLTETAVEQISEAEKSIYSDRRLPWDGNWLLVFLMASPMEPKVREKLEQELAWMGFGAIARYIWAHPQGSIDRLKTRIAELGLDGHVVCMSAQNILDSGAGLTIDDTSLVQQCSPTKNVEEEYRTFIHNFEPLRRDLAAVVAEATRAELTTLRILLIDQFRRVVLHDPHVPLALLPDDWVGLQARRLCAEIYSVLFEPTNQWYRKLCVEYSTIDDDPVSVYPEPTGPPRFVDG